MNPIRGVIAPNLTPFALDGTPDHSLYLHHARRLLDQGCSALAPFGTTGEALSLGMEERMRLLETLIEGGVHPTRLIPGTGLTSIPDTVTLTRHATGLGCAGVMTLPPFYYKGVSDEGLYRYFAELIERTADTRLRLYLYHIPPVAQVGLGVELVSRLARDFPGVVIGIKDSGGDWSNTARLLQIPDLIVYPGSELQFLRALSSGAPGCITATANINAAAIREVYERRAAADAATREAAVDAFRKTVQPFGPIPAMKALLARRESHSAWAQVRPPLETLPANRVAELETALAALA
jgi:4-hydroxy-tetrahydrodipicolinate synthase